jgi:hypothetical protein
MPTYSYECRCGKTITDICKISQMKKFKVCVCGKRAKRIIVGPAVLRDEDIPWMKEAVKTLQPDCERPVQTRQDWKRYMRENHLACIG